MNANAAAEIGELLRKEGLYSSVLANWRRQREDGTLAGLAPKKRGPKPKRKDEVTDELERLRRENTRLQQRLVQAEAIIAIRLDGCGRRSRPLPGGDERGRDLDGPSVAACGGDRAL